MKKYICLYTYQVNGEERCDWIETNEKEDMERRIEFVKEVSDNPMFFRVFEMVNFKDILALGGVTSGKLEK